MLGLQNKIQVMLQVSQKLGMTLGQEINGMGGAGRMLAGEQVAQGSFACCTVLSRKRKSVQEEI